MYGTVRVSVTNCGGSSPYTGITVYPGSGCGGYFSISPNPASDEITITINNNITLSAINDTIITNLNISNIDTYEDMEYMVKIFNNQGIIITQFTRSGKNFKIPINNLRDGFYIVELNNGNNYYREQLIVKHN